MHHLVIHCLRTVQKKNKTKNKLDYYRGKNCMKNFCLDLKKHATKIFNYERKK